MKEYLERIILTWLRQKQVRLRLGIYISFQIVDFNYKFINEEFENDKVWKVIIKFLFLTTFITIVNLTQIQI